MISIVNDSKPDRNIQVGQGPNRITFVDLASPPLKLPKDNIFYKNSSESV